MAAGAAPKAIQYVKVGCAGVEEEAWLDPLEQDAVPRTIAHTTTSVKNAAVFFLPVMQFGMSMRFFAFIRTSNKYI
jgi:hypothetical protein